MNEKRFTAILWMAKAALLVVLAVRGLRSSYGPSASGSVLRSGRRPRAAGSGRCTGRGAANPLTVGLCGHYSEKPVHGGRRRQRAAHRRRSRMAALDSLASAEELGLCLVGTIAGGPTASRAIIQDTKSNAAGSYRIGDAVASATVEAIQRDAVLLRYQGRPLVLRLRSGASNGAGQKAQSRPQNAGDTGPKTPEESQPSHAAGPAGSRAVAGGIHRGPFSPGHDRALREQRSDRGAENHRPGELPDGRGARSPERRRRPVRQWADN